MKTIFIQIVSYRDPELNATVNDCLNKAKHPDRLKFGICIQRNPADNWDNLDNFIHDTRFKIIDVNYKDSRGCCWARSNVQMLYDNEDYTLQLDSHHRFIQDWDEILINMLEELKKISDKPILTGYVPSYDPNDDTKLKMTPWMMEPYKSSENGIVLFRPREFRKDEKLLAHSPIKSKFYSGHFMFTIGQHCTEVKYDPLLYFTGEEMTMGARSYTHGYDMFHPHIPVIWHEYTRAGRIKHWDDFKSKTDVQIPFYEFDAISKKRIKAIFSCSKDSNTDLGIYGLGTTRSLKEYCDYSEVDWINNRIYGEPIVPKTVELISVVERSKTLKTYSYNIDWSSHAYKLTNEFDILSVIADDVNHKSIYRIDISDEQYISGERCRISISFDSNVDPKYIVIYSYNTKRQKWMDKINIEI